MNSKAKNKNYYQQVDACEKISLQLETSNSENNRFYDFQKQSTISNGTIKIQKMKKISDHKCFCIPPEKNKKKSPSFFAKIRKHFSRKKNKEEDQIFQTDKTRGKKFKSERRKSRKLGDLEKNVKKKKKKSKVFNGSKISFNKDVCTCEMCQLFNVGEDEFGDIHSIDGKRSRERQRRKIRKRLKGLKAAKNFSDTEK